MALLIWKLICSTSSSWLISSTGICLAWDHNFNKLNCCHHNETKKKERNLWGKVCEIEHENHKYGVVDGGTVPVCKGKILVLVYSTTHHYNSIGFLLPFFFHDFTEDHIEEGACGEALEDSDKSSLNGSVFPMFQRLWEGHSNASANGWDNAEGGDIHDSQGYLDAYEKKWYEFTKQAFIVKSKLVFENEDNQTCYHKY